MHHIASCTESQWCGINYTIMWSEAHITVSQTVCKTLLHSNRRHWPSESPLAIPGSCFNDHIWFKHQTLPILSTPYVALLLFVTRFAASTWGHLSLLHSGRSLLKWYKTIYMGEMYHVNLFVSIRRICFRIVFNSLEYRGIRRIVAHKPI